MLINGSGKWYAGQSFHATVVDIRNEDKTVKVQYTDGGYKRFQQSEFRPLVVGPAVESASFGVKSYEWAEDVLIPEGKANFAETPQVEELQGKIKDAIRSKNYEEAQNLKKQRDSIVKEVAEARQEKLNLLAAIQREDFKEARRWQSLVDAREAKLPKTEKSADPSKKDAPAKAPPTMGEILQKAGNRAFSGGIAGAAAMGVQVCSLMWMRTTMNYQYRYGTSTTEALKALYKDGGIPRFYRGILPALMQGPLSRFGDTAANAGIMSLMEHNETMKNQPALIKTVFASASAAAFRITLMPIDTVKTIMQVEGAQGLPKLRAKVAAQGPTAFFHGAIGASAATFAGHYPWFATYNTLNSYIPVPEDMLPKLGRNAGIGFCSSAVSDTVSNSIRVLKTYRQTSEVKVSYAEAARTIINAEGLGGLFGRGLQTRIIANGMQGMMFSILWKYFEDALKKG